MQALIGIALLRVRMLLRPQHDARQRAQRLGDFFSELPSGRIMAHRRVDRCVLRFLAQGRNQLRIVRLVDGRAAHGPRRPAPDATTLGIGWTFDQHQSIIAQAQRLTAQPQIAISPINLAWSR